MKCFDVNLSDFLKILAKTEFNYINCLILLVVTLLQLSHTSRRIRGGPTTSLEGTVDSSVIAEPFQGVAPFTPTTVKRRESIVDRILSETKNKVYDNWF